LRHFPHTKSQKQGVLVALLSLIAVILSLVGVFGMAIYEAKRMKKEIAIRKVWGATVPQILQLFSTPILKIILISAIISIPLACYGVYIWLKGFAYHIDLYWWVFVLATLSVVLTALATIIYQNYRAASSNPIDSIKFE
jgi:putative ABC transport system permease protein